MRVVITGATKGIGRSIGLDAASEDGLQCLGRSMPTATLGETVDIVCAMRFLVSDEAKSTTRQTLVVGSG